MKSQFQRKKVKLTTKNYKTLFATGHNELPKLYDYFKNFSKVYVFNSKTKTSYVEIVIGKLKFTCRLSNHPANSQRLNWYKDVDIDTTSFRDVINYYKILLKCLK